MKKANNTRKPNDSYIINENNELFRNLRTRIQLGYTEAKMISLVGQNIGSGTAELSYKLASSFAMANRKTLLIDGNLRSPELAAHFKGSFISGLEHILRNEAAVDNVVMETEKDNLYFLPSVESATDSTELLGTGKCANLMKQFKQQFDYIIVNTMPVEMGSDAFLLGKISDGVLVIVKESTTKHKDLQNIKLMMDEAKISILGSVYIEN